jgi:hypothetical protein
MRRVVCAALREAGFFAGAFDNEACWPGTADVWYHGGERQKTIVGELPKPRTGWTELKRVGADDVPKRDETPLRLTHYRPHQRQWHLAADKAGVRVTLLLLVGDEWFLFPAVWAAHHLGNVPISTLRASASVRWTGGFDLQKILPWL